MRGRIFQVKKTTLLALSFCLCFVVFVSVSLFLALDRKRYNDWFFVFCTLVGLHFCLRAYLMRVDSTCYLGVTMLLIGLFYFYSKQMGVYNLYPAFILLSFAFGSFFTYCSFKQPFQFTLFLSLFFATFALAFYLINAISLYIFLAFIFLCVLLLVCRYFII